MNTPTIPTNLDNLIGKFIDSVNISEDKTEIIFKTKQACYIYEAVGECCSQTWIQYIEGIEYLYGMEVLKIEAKKTITQEEEFSTLDIMGYDIYTVKGICHLDFRNESNGYYCGWLKLKEIKFMNDILSIKEVMEEHEKIVKQLSEMEKYCTKEAASDRYYTINLLTQEVNVLKKCFESVSNYYQFTITECAVVNSLIDNVLTATETFISNKNKGD